MDDTPLSPLAQDTTVYRCDACGNEFHGHQTGMEEDFEEEIVAGRELIIAVDYDDTGCSIEKIPSVEELEAIASVCKTYAFTCPKCGLPHPHGFQIKNKEDE